MIRAYRDGIPANGKSVPDGAKIAIVEWQKNRLAQAYGRDRARMGVGYVQIRHGI